MVKLIDDYYLLADSHCYMLKEKVVVKDENSKNYGEEDFRIIGYYSTIKNALEAILKSETRKYISKDKVNTLDELAKEIKNIEKKIDAIEINV